jgi:hypothetical protein
MLVGEGFDQGRIGESGSPEDRPLGARLERLVDVVGRAHASSDLHGDLDDCADLAHVVEVHRRPDACAVEVHHVKRAGALVDPAQRRLHRVGVEDCLAVVVALNQAHGLAPADVDRRIENQTGTDAQMLVKFRSSASPAPLDFSG